MATNQYQLMRSAKVVILGSTGFVGSAILNHLKEEKSVSVEGYNSSTLNLKSPECIDKLCKVLDEETILIVTSRSRRDEEPLVALSDDVVIAANVAQCLSRQKIRKCLYFSTISVYGDAQTNLNITEESPIFLTSPYGIAKYASESIFRQFSAQTGIPLVILRPCKVYGPGDAWLSYGPVGFVMSILQDRKVYIYGDGSELRDHLFIDDLVKITIQLALGDACGIYNVGSGKSHSFQEMIAYLRCIVDRDFDVVSVERSKLKIDQKICVVKLLSVLPDFQFTNLKQGIVETHKHFTQRYARQN